MNRLKNTVNCYFPLLLCILCLSGVQAQAPEPYGAVPSPRQLAWAELEYYMFVHFSMNTFTDMEWGTGGEDPALFNPTELDCRQWARIAKEAGMKGIIITAKHHDGFVLWPSAYTEHSVKNSPWKAGKGDVLRELREACDYYGLKMGIYYSPWDRNHADYGSEKYLDYLHAQLDEVLTQYGDIFEVWFDGANGGSGYYGGADEDRHVDRKTYYDWPRIWNHVRSLQPKAVIFSDAGPDVRWVGNERGFAGETNWATLNRDLVWPGWPHYKQLPSGHQNGTHWVPAEVDVSIRPGWYYHAYEDHKVKTLPELLDIYYHSVGRNGSMLLNIPVDRRGLIHSRDSAQLMALAQQLQKDFSQNLIASARVTGETYRHGDPRYHPRNMTDGNPDTYWTTDEFTRRASVVITTDSVITFNRLVLREYTPLGQRVQGFSVEVKNEAGEWMLAARETTIGRKRILRLEDLQTDQIRITVDSALASPVISDAEVYRAPVVMSAPMVVRDDQDRVSLTAADAGAVIHYTLDGKDPDGSSPVYDETFDFSRKGSVKARVTDPVSGRWSPVAVKDFDIPKSLWQVISGDRKMIDGDPRTVSQVSSAAGVVIRFDQEFSVKGFTYLPDQSRYAGGIIRDYVFSVSTDGKEWKPVSRGEFSNIRNNPIEQKVTFEGVRARYVKLEALRLLDDAEHIRVAELEVITGTNK